MKENNSWADFGNVLQNLDQKSILPFSFRSSSKHLALMAVFAASLLSVAFVSRVFAVCVENEAGEIVCTGTNPDGVETGDGDDTITVETGATVSRTVEESLASSGTGTATAIYTDGGDDQVTNKSTVSANADVGIDVNDLVVTHWGSDESDNSVTAEAIATGIDGGTSVGKDIIVNNGTIGDVQAKATISAGRINLDLVDLADADVSLTANTAATGIKGAASNEITNNGTLTVKSEASITDWTSAPDINVADYGTVTATDTPHATAWGIKGGNGYDAITNAGTITVSAAADTTVPHVEVNLVDLAVAGAGIGTEEDSMSASATGIDAGDGGGEIVNAVTGMISAEAESFADIENIALSVYDFTVAVDMRGTAGSIATHVDAAAVGIKAGDGDDRITNDGEIAARAKSSVFSLGIGVGAEGVPSGAFSPSAEFYSPLFTPADAAVAAAASATGIQCGAGNDTIINTGKLTVFAGPTDDYPMVLSVGASVSAPVLELTGLSDWLGSWNNLVDYPPAMAIISSGIAASATATGIDAGAGDDRIVNENTALAPVQVTAYSSATNVEGSGTFQNVKTEGGTGWSTNLDLSLSKATTETTSAATGFEGGSGDDTIDNRGYLNVNAEASSFGTGVSVVAELLKGMDKVKGWGLGAAAALTNVVTESTATATGISGGDGADTVYNFGRTNVDADAGATSIQADISVQGEIKGLGGGVTFADGSTASTASATGISAGDGADHVHNVGYSGSGLLHAYADANVSANSFSVTVEKASTGVDIGGALAKGSATAEANAAGIDGGAGNDVLSNEAFGTIDVKAEAAVNNLSAAVDVQASVKGVGAGVALIDTTTLTTADADGIFGGAGDDYIYNGAFSLLKSYAVSDAYAESFSVSVQGESTGLVLGGSLVIASTTANGTAVGIDGGSGQDEIRNLGTVDANTASTTNNLAVSVGVQGTVNGVGAGFAFTDATSSAEAETTGIAGGTGDDTISNAAGSKISSYADADAYADLLSVHVQGSSTGIVLGGAAALAESRATTTATGIDGGAGANTLVNEAYGMVDAHAESTANSLAFTVTVEGAVEGFGGQAALTDTSTYSTATATGLAGGDDQDTITNGTRANLISYAGANAYAESITANVQGATTGVALAGSLARGETTPTAAATGIFGGTGADTVANDGFLDVQAHTDSTSVAVAAHVAGVVEGVSVGASLTDSSTNATATATGIDGGAGDDTIFNYRTIQTMTDSTLRAAGVSFDFGGVPIGLSAGASLAKASANATGSATGIAGGAGDDTVTNTENAWIDADSTVHATSTSVGIAVDVIGAAWTDASAAARTGSFGIAGGDGADTLNNQGRIDSTTLSDFTASSVSVVLGAGYGKADAKGVADATSTGIDGGAGNNFITNFSTGSIFSTATATGEANSYNFQLGGGDSVAAGTEAAASAYGLRTFAGDDTLSNFGTISLLAGSTLTAENRSFKLFGVGIADVDSTASSRAVGIDAGDGSNTIVNGAPGDISATATATTTATSLQIEIGVDAVSASTTSNTHAVGIESGIGSDTIFNFGSIEARAKSSTTTVGGTIDLASVSFADSSPGSEVEGINAGGGNDIIVNTGLITVGGLDSSPLAYAEVGTVSFNFTNLSSTQFSARAKAAGIAGGSGDDTILNQGTIAVGGDEWMSRGLAYGFTGSFLGMTSVGATAETVSTGIDGGDGGNYLINDTTGVLNVKASSTAYTGGAADSSFGMIAAFAGATSTATATGIAGGTDNDTVDNKGTIDVAATAWADSYADADIGGGSPTADASATATAVASGIDGGSGVNAVTNEGGISVQSDASATPISRADANIGRTDSDASATVTSTAYGIFAGDDGSRVTNAAGGSIRVTAEADTEDDTGRILTASQDVEADVYAFVTAKAVGIATGSGDDILANAGEITIVASSTPAGYANTSSYAYYPSSDARIYSSAIAIGMDAGKGTNQVANTGTIDVTAWSDANPITDSWARDWVATTNAVASSNAAATGIEGTGIITNAATGDVNVTARATAYADSISEAEHSNGQATLAAAATGISTAVDCNGDCPAVPDVIANLGSLTVSALAGENEDALALTSVYADSHIWVRDAHSSATGTAGVVATGIELGEGAARVVNSGSIDVTAREHMNATATAFSRDYNPNPTATAAGNAAAAGIAGTGNNYHVVNDATGEIRVNVEANAFAVSSGSTNCPRYAWGTSTATASAAADGIRTDDTASTIVNEGKIEVESKASASTNSSADAGSSSDGIATSTSTATAEAFGIHTGGGDDSIFNGKTLIVKSTATSYAYAYADADGWGEGEISTTNAIGSAKTWGIQGGDGNNFIVNEGDLEVTAEATSTAISDTEDETSGRISSFQVSALALGIETGSGNDLVSNYGTITTMQTENGVSTSGIAITTGSGNDTVALGAGSTTTGTIDLGAGDDTLMFLGAAAVNGAIDPGAGSNTLVFDGTGTLDYSFSGFETTVKQGAGTFVLSALPTMKSLAVDEGTLRIESNYSMAEDGSFRTIVNSDGSSGRFSVSGTVGLDGGLTVNKGRGYFFNGAAYDIITAESIEGAFSDIALPEANSLVSFTMEQTSEAVQIETRVKSFTTVASNPVARRVADYLDRIQYVASGDLLAVLAEVQNLPPDRFGQAFSSLSPDSFNNYSLASFNIARQFLHSFRQRMNTVRVFSLGGEVPHHEKPILLAYSGTDLAQFLPSSPKRKKYGFWFKGLWQNGDQEDDDGYAGYDFSLKGVALGIDRTFGNHLVVGAGFGYSRADIDLSHDSGDGDIDSYLGSLYGSWFRDNFYLDGMISYGQNQYDNRRHIVVGSLQGDAVSDHDGDIFSAYLGGGYSFDIGKWSAGPIASLQYAALSEDCFNEEGGGSVGLHVEERNTEALVSEAGLRIRGDLEITENILSVLELKGAWRHDFAIDEGVITASFSGSPGLSFATPGQDVEKNGILLGAGLTLLHKKGFSLTVDYQGDFRPDYRSHAVSAELRYIF